MISAKRESGLRASDLKIGYATKGRERKAVSGSLSLRLNRGEFVCLLGPNGVGKSTLIRTLAGMHEPLSGRIEIANTDLGSMSPKEKARAISVVLTDSLPHGLFTAYAVVALGRHPHTNWAGRLSDRDRERVQWAMDAVDATSLAHRQISELSDGERQKVMIARALAQEASIILLDEPTAFLDLPRRVDLMRVLRALARREGLSILLSTHDLDLALRSADQLWLYNQDGSITTGIPEELALRGDIAATFDSEELDWDAELGSFRMHREACASIAFSGEGPVADWTRRALQRIGYEVVGIEGRADLSLVIVELDGQPIWRLRRGTEEYDLRTLESLIQQLSAKLEPRTDANRR